MSTEQTSLEDVDSSVKRGPRRRQVYHYVVREDIVFSEQTGLAVPTACGRWWTWNLRAQAVAARAKARGVGVLCQRCAASGLRWG